MSIELKIVAPELAAALNNLAAAIAGKGIHSTDTPAQEATTASPPAKGRKAKADAPAPSAEQPSAGTTEHTFKPEAPEQPSGEAKVEPTSASTEAAASDEPIPYDEVRKRILEIGAKKSRDAVLELLSEFGVSGGKDLKPDQYAEFVEAADKVLAE